MSACLAVKPLTDQPDRTNRPQASSEAPVAVIKSLSVQGGVLTVDFASFGWETDSFDINLVTLDPPFPGQPNGVQLELAGDATSCTYQHLVGGHNYRFSVQSCAKYDSTGSSVCSDGVSMDFAVSVANGWVPPMQQARAVARDPGHLDVFAVAGDKRVWWRSWSEEAPPWSIWQPIGGNFAPGNVVTAVSRDPGQIDLYAVHGDGQVWTAWWTQGSSYAPIRPLGS